MVSGVLRTIEWKTVWKVRLRIIASFYMYTPIEGWEGKGRKTGNSYGICLLGIVNNWHRLGEGGTKQWQLELKTFF